jgi:hypothetical protein
MTGRVTAFDQKRYWRIEILKGLEPVFRNYVPGNLSNYEAATILQRLASRDLTPREVVAASIRKPRRTGLLDFRVDGPPRGKRVMIWLPDCPEYVASYWHSGEIAEYPEIFGDD